MSMNKYFLELYHQKHSTKHEHLIFIDEYGIII